METFWAILAKNRILLFAISGHTAVVPNSAQLFYTIKSDRKKFFCFVASVQRSSCRLLSPTFEILFTFFQPQTVLIVALIIAPGSGCSVVG